MKFCHEILETLSYHMVKTHLYLNSSLNGIVRDGQTDQITIPNVRYT